MQSAALTPGHRYPTQLDAAVAVYELLAKDVGVRPERAFVAGDSAGGMACSL